MASDVTLYMFNGSAPSLTARLMLEHKGIEHRCKHLMVRTPRVRDAAARL